MYEIKNRLVPEYPCDIFTNVNDMHDHNTRQSVTDLILPKPKTNSMKNAFSYGGAEVWNSPPASLKSATSLPNFKFELTHVN